MDIELGMVKVMRDWNDFIGFMDVFPKMDTHSVVLTKPEHNYNEDLLVVESIPIAVEANTEENAKNALIAAIEREINDGSRHHVYVRYMPVVVPVKNIDGAQTGSFGGHARIAYAPKVQT